MTLPDRDQLALTISRGNDTDVSEWDHCLLMADRILAAGWSMSPPKPTIVEALEKALSDLDDRKIVKARVIIERVIKELRK